MRCGFRLLRTINLLTLYNSDFDDELLILIDHLESIGIWRWKNILKNYAKRNTYL